jgi:hypothetical protein
MGNGGLSHHQHVEDDHRRKAKDHRPYPERPHNVFGGESPLIRENLVFREELLFSKHLVLVSEDHFSKHLLSKHCVLVVHDAPAFFFMQRTIAVQF